MRALSRRLRAFHPATNLCLESKCPVSVVSIAIAGDGNTILAKVAPTVTPECRTSRGQASSVGAMPRDILDIDDAVSNSVAVARPRAPFVLTSHIADATARVEKDPHPAAAGPDMHAASIISLSAASTPTVSLSAATGAFARGVGAPTPQGSGVATPQASTSSTPVGAAANDDGIRPMAMSSTDPRAIQAATVKPFDGTGGTGGGPPPIVNPDLLVTGGGWGGANKISDGHYRDPNPIPVGAIVEVVTGSPPSGYLASSYTWGNGTDYKSYFNQDGGATPNSPQRVGTGVDTSLPMYTFITDNNPRTYTITCSVLYQAGAYLVRGYSTIEFTTQRPTTSSLDILSQGQATLRPPALGATTVTVVMTNAGNQNDQYSGLDVGILIKATTASQFRGDFMFLQTVDSQFFQTTPGPPVVVHSQTNIGGGANLDTEEGNHVGYPIYTDPPPPGQEAPPAEYSWPTSGTGTITTKRMVDSPQSFNDGGVITQLSLGKFNGDGSLAKPWSAYTYLMFRPESGVWVALARVYWATAANAVKDPNTGRWSSPGPATLPQPPNDPMPAVGPEWTGLSSNQAMVP